MHTCWRNPAQTFCLLILLDECGNYHVSCIRFYCYKKTTSGSAYLLEKLTQYNIQTTCLVRRKCPWNPQWLYSSLWCQLKVLWCIKSDASSSMFFGNLLFQPRNFMLQLFVFTFGSFVFNQSYIRCKTRLLVSCCWSGAAACHKAHACWNGAGMVLPTSYCRVLFSFLK